MIASAPPSSEEIEKWTPLQQMETLSRLAGIVMARQKSTTLSIPGSAVPAPNSRRYILTEIPEPKVTLRRPEPGDRELIELNWLAADPAHRIPMNDTTIRQMLED